MRQSLEGCGGRGARRSRLLSVVIVLISGTVAWACYDKDAHLPTDPGTVGALQLVAAPQSIPADGFSKTTITAKVDPGTAAANRQITFKTTSGSFVNFTGDAAVTADIAGKAAVDLRSSKDIGPAHVTAIVSGGSNIARTIDVVFLTPNLADTIRIGASVTQAAADTASVLQVFADIAAEIPASNRTVTFTSSLGNFVSSGNNTAIATADATNRATADLRTNSVVGIARLTASVSTIANQPTVAQTTVQFVPALPDYIVVDPGPLDIKANATVNVMARLRRNVGVVSDGSIVVFTATDNEAHNPLGGFLNITPAASGVATAAFSPNGTAYRGAATIRATAVGVPVFGDATVRIVAP